MALCHFPFSIHPVLKFSNPHLKWGGAHHYPIDKTLTFTCTAEKLGKNGKGSRPSKSNEEVCNELREFMSAAGLPGNCVPTMKELLENGRKDLANIVRRRGYKVITELLRNSFNNDSNTEKPSIKDENSEVQEGILIEYAESASSPSGSSVMGKYISRTNGAIATDNTSVQKCESPKSSVSSLRSRAVDFVQTGKLDIFEEAFEIKSGKMETDSDHKSDCISSDDPADIEAFEIKSGKMETDSDHKSDSISSDDPADIAYVDFQLACHLAQQTDRDHVIFNRGLKGADSDENLTSEMAGERINQVEIDRLKAMLREKEMELLELKRQIEKEKQSLSILQDKANKEIDNAHRMVTEKDMELRAAEEGLCGLKEVQIEYWGNCETVEVAGSFNGWHNRIKMDLHPSSKPLDSSCLRSLDLWSTILWLYPGIYEIKFIVDGTWRIDPSREISTGCSITNNILRVDR